MVALHVVLMTLAQEVSAAGDEIQVHSASGGDSRGSGDVLGYLRRNTRPFSAVEDLREDIHTWKHIQSYGLRF